jgi:hypothetical protein
MYLLSVLSSGNVHRDAVYEHGVHNVHSEPQVRTLYIVEELRHISTFYSLMNTQNIPRVIIYSIYNWKAYNIYSHILEYVRSGTKL